MFDKFRPQKKIEIQNNQTPHKFKLNKIKIELNEKNYRNKPGHLAFPRNDLQLNELLDRNKPLFDDNLKSWALSSKKKKEKKVCL